jgi:hypothetical protein
MIEEQIQPTEMQITFGFDFKTILVLLVLLVAAHIIAMFIASKIM